MSNEPDFESPPEAPMPCRPYREVSCYERRRPMGMIWLLVILLILAILPLLLPYLIGQIQYTVTLNRQKARAEVAREFLDRMPDPKHVWPWVAKAIEPCVVRIETTRREEGPGLLDEWSHFGLPQRQWEAHGEGSGVIVEKSGYIVTNFHVVKGAVQVTVKLSNGRSIEDVEVIGVDPPSDVAVLKIADGELMTAPWGDSDELEVGEAVLAVGSPFGLERTVTSGIISAKGRQGIVPNLGNREFNQEFLQTDAAVNPGNSGGPLVNIRGEVVGINTAIHGQTYQGISFAIPSNLVRDIFERLKTEGKIIRGWLGVQISDLDKRLVEKLKLPGSKGALVLSVVAGSPAQKAGVQPGDVIVKWNDAPVERSPDLSRMAAAAEVGSQVTVSLIRNGQEQDLTVTITERPTQLE
ncbi:MAG: trypsin-like peptidase domain-containing protein [Pirellulales bacterium]|nr:trypsin-like peptidase domain-containing protein [Pirellulales bacterium]